MVKGTLYKTSGEKEEVEINTFKDLQKIIGGYVEMYGFTNEDLTETTICFDEDGLSKNLPTNEEGTKLLKFVRPDLRLSVRGVVGDVVILSAEDFTSLKN